MLYGLGGSELVNAFFIFWIFNFSNAGLHPESTLKEPFSWNPGYYEGSSQMLTNTFFIAKHFIHSFSLPKSWSFYTMLKWNSDCRLSFSARFYVYTRLTRDCKLSFFALLYTRLNSDCRLHNSTTWICTESTNIKF